MKKIFIIMVVAISMILVACEGYKFEKPESNIKLHESKKNDKSDSEEDDKNSEYIDELDLSEDDGSIEDEEFSFMPSDFLTYREQRDDFASFDEMIGLLEKGEGYTYLKLNGSDEKLLAISNELFVDDSEGIVEVNDEIFSKDKYDLAATSMSIYAESTEGVIMVGYVYSGSKMYPLKTNGEVVFLCEEHKFETNFLTPDGNGLMVKENVYESIDETTNTITYGGFVREKPDLSDEGKKVNITTRDEFLAYFDEYWKLEALHFEVVE